MSGPGWSATLCGMDNTDTGVTSNSWRPTWLDFDEDLTPITGRDIMMPCVFHELKSRDANIRTAIFYDWDWFKWMASKGYPNYVDLVSIYGYTMPCKTGGTDKNNVSRHLMAVGRPSKEFSSEF